DLAAAAWAIAPSLVTVEETRARLHRNLWVEYGTGERRVKVARDLDVDGIWNHFRRLVRSPPPR
ncbi:MAG TPA: hypothetical protein VIJ36_14635, partial [Thermoanaerobaculia bacterium]